MKNISKLMSFVAIATLFFVGCNKENSINEQEQQHVVLNLDVNVSEDVNVSDDANTKAKYKAGWAEGDKLYLLFTNNMFEYEPAKYVEVKYTSGKWKVTKGQEVLDGLKKNGSVDICYCPGTPVPNTTDGTIKFPNTTGAFTMVANMKSYTITNKVISITTKLYLNAIQLNIKNLSPTKKAVLVNLSKKEDGSTLKFTDDTEGYGDVVFTKYGISRGSITKNYPAQETSDPTESAFFFKPNSWDIGYTVGRFTLMIPIEGTECTMIKDINNLDLTINQCFSLKGPSATDEEIKAAAKNADLGNGWIKM